MNSISDYEWITVKELASYLKITESLARQLCRSKGFPAQKFGREWRIHMASLVEKYGRYN